MGVFLHSAFCPLSIRRTMTKESVFSQEDAVILVVDDTPANLHLLRTLLSARGYSVRSAPTGRHALIFLKKTLPDLILLDIKMPEIDGYDMCRLLKKEKRTADIPIIFISALDTVTDKVKAFALGGADYISKPFHPDEVLSRVRTHLDLKKVHRELADRNRRLEKEILERKHAENALRRQSLELQERLAERDRLIAELKKAAIHIKTLNGLLPICASCKNIRNDEGYWEQIEVYIRDHADITFTHSICPNCKIKLYPPDKYPELYRDCPDGANAKQNITECNVREKKP